MTVHAAPGYPQGVENNDFLLVLRMAQGDAAALHALFDRYAPQVYALSHAILGPGHEAADVVQECFLHAWRRAASYSPEAGTVRSWLLLHARELAIEVLRGSDWVNQVCTPAFLPAHWAPVQRRAQAAIDDPISGAERAAVQQAVAGLSQEQRTMLELAYFDMTPQLELARRQRRPLPQLQAQFTAMAREIHMALQDMRR